MGKAYLVSPHHVTPAKLNLSRQLFVSTDYLEKNRYRRLRYVCLQLERPLLSCLLPLLLKPLALHYRWLLCRPNFLRPSHL